ncbi:MAG: hypothetical protein Q9180_006946 [Flavoplaca navasiana]
MSSVLRCNNHSMARHHNPWTSLVTLNSGTAWTSNFVRAMLALEIVMTLALTGTLLSFLVTHKRTSAAEKRFIWFLAAISLMIFTSTFHFIDTILNEQNHCVQAVYLIFQIIFVNLRYLADALLLAAIFAHLSFKTTDRDSQSLRSRGPTFVHLLMCLPLGLLWLVITVLYLVIIIQQITRTGSVSNSNFFEAVRKLDLAYNGIYFIAAVEIFALGLIILTSSLKQHSHTLHTGRNKKLLFLFAVLISVPLMIRAFWQIVITARWNLSDETSFDDVTSPPIRLTHMLFYYLCTTLVYIGLALVIRGPTLETIFASVHQAQQENAVLGPEIPIMRVAAPVENVQPFNPHAPTEPSRWSRISRDHSQDPIYNGP